MKEELINSLVQIEKDARQIEDEGKREIAELQKEYQDRMNREEEEFVTRARQEGEKLVECAENEAKNYARQRRKNTQDEIEQIRSGFDGIKEELTNYFFDQITGTGDD